MSAKGVDPRGASRVAWITGATSGLGRAAARVFARKGVRVALCGRSQERGEELVEELSAEGGEGFFKSADVSSSLEMERFASTALERYKRLDFAFNAARTEGPLRRTAHG